MQRIMRTALGLLAMLALPAFAYAGWEAEAKIGYDSNINRSVTQEESDTSLGALLSYTRDPDPARAIDWTLRAALEGVAYRQTDDLTSLGVSIAPGVSVSPASWWQVGIVPFLQTTAVRDDDQSAWAFGGSVHLDQQWTQTWYSGEYYTYTDSRARADTYSFSEHAAGVFVGMSPGGAFFSEVGYEYAHGSSFQTVPTATTTVISSGRNRRYSTAFGADVLREDVTRHSGALTIGYTLGSHTPYLGYRYTTSKGDLGTVKTHEAFIGLRHAF